MRFVPKIQYNNGGVDDIELFFSLPQKLWIAGSRPHGGGNISDAGIPEAFVIRRDQLVEVELRFTESEWPDVADWLEYVQSNGASFRFWFDVNDPLTEYTVYLDSPEADDELMPSRDEFTSVLQMKMTFRSTTATRFDVRAR